MNAATGLEPKRLRDDRIGTAGADADIRRKRRHRKSGGGGDGKGQGDDDQPADQSRIAHHPPQAQVHDDAQDGQQGRYIDPGEGAEFFGTRPGVRTGGRFVSH